MIIYLIEYHKPQQSPMKWDNFRVKDLFDMGNGYAAAPYERSKADQVPFDRVEKGWPQGAVHA